MLHPSEGHMLHSRAYAAQKGICCTEGHAAQKGHAALQPCECLCQRCILLLLPHKPLALFAVLHTRVLQPPPHIWRRGAVQASWVLHVAMESKSDNSCQDGMLRLAWQGITMLGFKAVSSRPPWRCMFSRPLAIMLSCSACDGENKREGAEGRVRASERERERQRDRERECVCASSHALHTAKMCSSARS